MQCKTPTCSECKYGFKLLRDLLKLSAVVVRWCAATTLHTIVDAVHVIQVYTSHSQGKEPSTAGDILILNKDDIDSGNI